MKGKSKRLRSVLALVFAASAIAAPVAYAAPVEDYLPDSAPAVEQGVDSYSSLNAISPPTTPPSAPTQGSVTASDGFDWGDAGIGAASMLALTAIAAGVALVAFRPRSRHGIA
jgi:hypothetical protein